MNLLLITFSLRNPQKDYSQFFVALRGNALQWWHFIEQTCIVTTLHDANTYTRQLLPHIEATDSLLIVKITPHEFQGWLPTDAWDWLNKVSTDSQQLSLPALTPGLPWK
ncbi:MAG: hypothetical protein WCC22_10560 [Terriglobales bacterium]